MLEEAYADSDADNKLKRLLNSDINTYPPGQLLVKMDVATMASSFEMRSPLLDCRLLRLRLPDHIVDGKNTGFGVLPAWFRGELLELRRNVLLDERLMGRGTFRTEALAASMDDHVSGRQDNSSRLWSLIQLELWVRTCVDRTVLAKPVSLALDS
jgi:asparagine synthase (glutamine-hydrolysing)